MASDFDSLMDEVQGEKKSGASASGVNDFDSIMKEVEGEKAGSPASSQDGSVIGSLAKQFGQGALETGAGTIGLGKMIGSIPRWIENKAFGPEPVYDQKGNMVPQGTEGAQPAGSSLSTENLLNSAQRAGMYDPNAQPQTTADSIARWAGRTAAALPVGAIGGEGGFLANLLSPRNVAYTALPSAAAQYMQDEYNMPAYLTAPMYALGITGLERGVGGVIQANRATEAAVQAQTAAEAATAAKTNFDNETRNFVNAQKQQKSENDALAQRGADFRLRDAQKAHADEMAGADVDRAAIADKLGSSLTIQQGTQQAQNSARDWLKQDFPDKVKAAEDGLNIIPSDARGTLDNFKSVLQNSNYGAGEAEPIAQMFQSNLPQRLLGQVNRLGLKQSTAEEALEGGEPKTPDLSFQDMRKLRSVLGDALKDQKTVRDVGAGRLNEMYAALGDDMRENINQNVGPLGLEAFGKYNQEASRLYNLASGPVNDIISGKNAAKETITPDQVYKNLMDGTGYSGVRLADLGSEVKLKQGLNEVASANLRKGLTGLNTPGDPEAEFAQMSPEAKSAFYGDQHSGAIQDVIDRRAQAEKNITDQTAAIQKMQKQVEKTGKVALDAQKLDRDNQGKALTQTAKEAQAKADELASQQKEVNSPGVKAWEAAKKAGWLLGGGGLMAENPLLPSLGGYITHTGTEVPGWVHPAMGIAGGLGGWGARELFNNPAASTNVLRGTLPVLPFGTKPGE